MEQSQMQWPDAGTIREDATGAGGMDPMSMRFRVVEFRKSTGMLLGIPAENLSFPDAVEATKSLIRRNSDSHYFLEPIGFLQ